jgi:lipopolysaccharide transport system permease protein
MRPGRQSGAGVSLIRPKQGWWDVDLREMWEYRELLYFLVWRELKVRYKQTVIGAGWAVIQPLFTMGVFTVLFGRLAKLPSEGLPYPIFYYSALLPWTYFSNSLTTATSAVTENRGIITKVYFPRAILPLAAALWGLADLACGCIGLIVLMIVYRVHLDYRVLLLPLPLALAVAAALGVGLWLTALNAMYRDVKYVLPFFVQLWMFATPVIYPSSLVPRAWRGVYGFNPMVTAIEGFRWTVTGHGQLTGAMMLASAGAAVALIASGVMVFNKIDSAIPDIV